MNQSIFRKLPVFIILLICLLNNQFLYSQQVYKIERLPAAINSEFEEIKPFSTANGDSLFFIRSYSADNTGGASSGEDIWLSTCTKTQDWTPATNNFGYKNSQGPDIFAGLSCNGNSLFTISYEQSKQNRILNISAHQLKSHSASDAPSNLNTQILIGFEYHDVYLNPSGNIALISMETLNSLGQEDIYISLKNAQNIWSAPFNIGATINTRGYEISPFLSVDEQVLYFSSDGYGGYGDADIYFSKRLGDSWINWSSPINMGEPFNSQKFDAYLSKNGINEYYISSNRNGKYSDIYKIYSDNERHAIDDSLLAVSSTIEDQNLVEKSSMPDSKNNTSRPNQLILFFEFDGHVLSNDQEQDLLGFLNLYTSDTLDYSVIIEGYTDNSGSESYNQRLAMKRSKAVSKLIRKNGFKKEQLMIEGKGVYTSYETLAPALMRRVEVKMAEYP